MAPEHWYGKSDITATNTWNVSNTATNYSLSIPRVGPPAERIRLDRCMVVLERKDYHPPTWVTVAGHYYKRVTRRGKRHYYKWRRV